MESTIEELKQQLTYAELRAEESLRLEWVVWEWFRNWQKQITNNCFALVSSLRIRIEERLTNPLQSWLDQ